MKAIITLSLLIASTLVVDAGGGWTQAKGRGYYKVSQWWINASQHFDNVGNMDPNATYVLANTVLYAEYGLTDRITGVLNFPFFSHAHINSQVSATTGQVLLEGDQINTVGDTDLSFKYRLSGPNQAIATSMTLLLGLPTGEPAGGRDGNLQTGDGEFNQMLRFDISRSFALDQNFTSFGNVYGGLNNRTNGFSDEFRYGVEVGISLKRRLWLINKLDILTSLKNGDPALETNDGATLFANNAEYTAYTLEGAYYLTEKIGISASFSTALDGRLIFASPAYSVGIFLDRQ